MKLLPFLLVIATVLLTGCDPKVNERAARFDPAKCPTCVDGTCRYCGSDSKCHQCDGEGQRTTSTKNYTGEGVELVDLVGDCAFCKGTGTCSYCEGSGKCYQCDGKSTTENWEQSNNKYNKRNEK